MSKKSTLLILLLLLKLSGYSQNIDSLKQVLKTAKEDTTRVNILLELSEILYSSKPDTVIILCEQALSIIELKQNEVGAKENKALLKSKALALNNIGFVYKNKGEIQKTLAFYTKSLKISEEIKDKSGIANSLINIGAVYYNQGNIPMALDYFIRCLKIQEEIHNKQGIAYALNNIGLIYQDMSDAPKALDYFTRSLKLWEEIKYNFGIATALNNIGAMYDKLGDTPKALDYYQRSLRIQEQINNRRGIASTLYNIGFIYYNKGDFSKALDYYDRGLKIQEAINDKNGIATSLSRIAQVMLKQGRIGLARDFGERSLKAAQELKFPKVINMASSTLSKIYIQTNNWKGAYEMLLLSKKMSDTINNETNRKVSIQKGFQYEYEKKVAADSVRTTLDRKVFDAQSKQEKIKRTALYIGISLFAVFSLFMYNRFRVTRKQKDIIEVQKKLVEKQKHLVEAHSKEISDSINYAERIQRSLLASKDLLEENLKEHFVFFQPKAVVSGDFYWATQLPGNKFALVTADSTGHGVPGAIMSMLNISCLKESVKEGLVEPSDILINTRKLIIETLKKDGSAEGGKDGMDCSLISFDFNNKKLTYSAANNPVWIIRRKEILEFSYDKMPVGKNDRDTLSFTQHTIELQQGDMVYTITDGMPDQFGGPKGKKFMYQQLKELLISVSHLQMSEQKENISSSMNDWKGELEQVDDVTLIGVRI